MSGYLTGILVLLALNVVLAYAAFLPLAAGQLNLGLAGFAAIGAYAAAYASNSWAIAPTLAVALGGCVAGLLALLVAVPVLRTRGIYLALATFALGQIVQAGLLNLDVGGAAAQVRIRLEQCRCEALVHARIALGDAEALQHGRAIAARLLAHTIAEAARVTLPGGCVVILDSPFYRRAIDGERMVAEKRETARRTWGERAADLLALPAIEYLTATRLAEASAPCGLSWRRHRVWQPLSYELRPLARPRSAAEIRESEKLRQSSRATALGRSVLRVSRAKSRRRRHGAKVSASLLAPPVRG